MYNAHDMTSVVDFYYSRTAVARMEYHAPLGLPISTCITVAYLRLDYKGSERIGFVEVMFHLLRTTLKVSCSEGERV